MEWLAGIIVLGKTPRFSEIRGPSPVKTPILPFKIHSADMAELLGIWSSDGSLTYVHDHTNDKIIPTFIVTNRDEAFLKTLDGLIRRIVGEINISVDKSYKTKNQFRIRNKIFIDILRDAGAVAGRKADLFTNIGVPRWIKKNTEYIIRWFRGVLECDGDVKISHKKRTYAVRYSRNISINLPEEIINMLVNRGKRNKLTGSFSAPFGMIKNFDFQVVVPKIISDETKMLQRLFPRDRVRVYKERIFYYPKTKRSTLKWTISINGKNATIQCLKVISPPRLVRKATSKGLLPAIMRSQYLH